MCDDGSISGYTELYHNKGSIYHVITRKTFIINKIKFKKGVEITIKSKETSSKLTI